MTAHTWIALISGLLLWSGTASADFYRCPQKNGKVEFRDFPCEMSARPVNPSSRPNAAGTLPPAQGGALNYEASSQICMQLLRQYDMTTPSARCRLGDQVCLDNANREIEAIYQKLTSQPAWRANRCDLMFQAEHKGGEFTVVGATQSCKYFVAEQNGNYSLVEEWLCSRPRQGDIGKGDVSAYGLKNVSLNGMTCTVYVDDWLLSKWRATEKFYDKCRLK